MLEQKRLTPADLHELLADWLIRWGRLSRRERPIRRAELERVVLSPAARLLPDQSDYRRHLSRLCDQAAGLRCPFVANHGDLTTSNILIDETVGLGVVDWEEASAEALPLTDYFYATADAVAAVGGYTDRPRSFVMCFGIDGEHTESVRRLTHRVADALDVDDRLREICFHACWLHHADNEAARRDRNGVRRFRSYPPPRGGRAGALHADEKALTEAANRPVAAVSVAIATCNRPDALARCLKRNPFGAGAARRNRCGRSGRFSCRGG